MSAADGGFVNPATPYACALPTPVGAETAAAPETAAAVKNLRRSTDGLSLLMLPPLGAPLIAACSGGQCKCGGWARKNFQERSPIMEAGP